MTDPENPTLEPAAAADVPPTARLMLRIVYIMGVVLVLLFLALVGGIIWKSAQKPARDAAEAPHGIDLGLASGSAVKSMALDGDRLAVDTGTEIIVVDLRKNAVLARIATIPK